jgi:peptidoglycan/xylan/chitin deacetylase (PgdA/CDA1 family)
VSRAPRPFRVAVLTGRDDLATASVIRRALAQPGVRLAGIFVDAAVQPRAETATDAIRRRIFPREIRSLRELCAREEAPYVELSPEPGELARRITDHGVDLLVLADRRARGAEVLGAARLGAVAARTGGAAQGADGWAAFWALYDRVGSVGLEVHHLVAAGEGGAVRRDAVPVSSRETLWSLGVKLDEATGNLLAASIGAIASGEAAAAGTEAAAPRTYPAPTRAERAALDRRLGTTGEPWLKRALKTAFYRVCLDGGPIALRNAWLRARRQTRYTVLLYHRVNDVSRDNLTTSVDRFIEGLGTLKARYPVVSLSAMVEASRGGHYLGPNVVAITFDDGYADNCELAAPILAHFALPATFFVSAGLVDTDVPFPHDGKSPHRFRNLAWSQVSDMAARGFEIGSHGWVHRNLAQCGLDEARSEIVRSRAAIEDKLGVTPRSFAYPYGGRQDINPEVARELGAAGFEIVASAYGGTNVGRVDPGNVLRIGASEAFDALALRASVEGVTFQAIRRLLGADRRVRPVTAPGTAEAALDRGPGGR